MKKSIKKISALALMMVFMTESVSAAGINSVIHLTGETVSRLNNGFNRLVDAFDNTTSGMAFDELISGSAIDETTSGQAFE